MWIIIPLGKLAPVHQCLKIVGVQTCGFFSHDQEAWQAQPGGAGGGGPCEARTGQPGETRAQGPGPRSPRHRRGSRARCLGAHPAANRSSAGRRLSSDFEQRWPEPGGRGGRAGRPSPGDTGAPPTVGARPGGRGSDQEPAPRGVADGAPVAKRPEFHRRHAAEGPSCRGPRRERASRCRIPLGAPQRRAAGFASRSLGAAPGTCRCKRAGRDPGSGPGSDAFPELGIPGYRGNTTPPPRAGRRLPTPSPQGFCLSVHGQCGPHAPPRRAWRKTPTHRRPPGPGARPSCWKEHAGPTHACLACAILPNI